MQSASTGKRQSSRRKGIAMPQNPSLAELTRIYMLVSWARSPLAPDTLTVAMAMDHLKYVIERTTPGSSLHYSSRKLLDEIVRNG